MLDNLHTYVRFNQTGQVVSVDLPHLPSSATSVSVYHRDTDDDGTSETALGSPSVATGSTTVDAASGVSQANPKKLNVVSTSDMAIGQQWLVTNAAGQTERPVIESIVTNDYIICQRALKYDYASADTVVLARLQATIDATWIADETNVSDDPLNPNPQYRIRWVYVFGGATYEVVSWFDVVRQVPTFSVTMEDCDRLARGLGFRLSVDDYSDDGDELITESIHQVKVDLFERKLTHYAFRNSAVVNELIRMKAVYLVAYQMLMHGGVGELQYRTAKADYWERMNNLVGSAAAEVQVTAEGATGTTRPAPIRRR